MRGRGTEIRRQGSRSSRSLKFLRRQVIAYRWMKVEAVGEVCSAGIDPVFESLLPVMRGIVSGHCQCELESQSRGRVARMPRCACINRRGPVGYVLCNVRCHVEIAQIVDEIARIVRLVGTRARSSSGLPRVRCFPMRRRVQAQLRHAKAPSSGSTASRQSRLRIDIEKF
jgi:hypothetical protein